ncbi:hypothetical protein D9619_000422 [Psilocybe cf. subviscida]|uniref:WIBG Mago-binding domain-containing protein n=1 Tax=Psilocybe cf. subviscida TaxID=2480587 RepID=A0A8H5BHT2_9AGAR|nr:hypothetical protein D9619_000422 [Psilocybe cf. subviscida]
MSRPPLNPEKTTAGIAVDPQTLERVIPESRRPDGTVRKQIKIRPGFTPQEDVRRFRGTKQAQMDSNALPKGQIIGWAPPPTSTAKPATDAKPLSKAAKKNAKRKEKREQEKDEVPENWDGDEPAAPAAVASKSGPKGENGNHKDTKSSDDADSELSKGLETLDLKK